MAKRTIGASEGDAYYYTKKVLNALPSKGRIEFCVRELVDQNTSWTRACYNLIRSRFFMNGVSNILFAPGVARIAFDELHMEDDDEDGFKLAELDSYVQMISANHSSEYTRKLAINGAELNFTDLRERYGVALTKKTKELEQMLESRTYKNGHYKIVHLKDFRTAHYYAKYANKYFSWCHLESENAFNSYSKDGIVRLYLALKKGYRNMTPDDPDFGASMLGIDIGPRGELIHVNNRWNHAHDNVDVRKGDNKYDASELSDLLGMPYYKACPPPNKEYFKSIGLELMSQDDLRKVPEFGTMTDPRDGNTYRTATINGVTIMVDDFKYIPGEQLSAEQIQRIRELMSQSVLPVMMEEDRTEILNRVAALLPAYQLLDKSYLPVEKAEGQYNAVYNWYGAVAYAPPGWHVPTKADIDKILGKLGYKAPSSYLFGHISYENYNFDATYEHLRLFDDIGLGENTDRQNDMHDELVLDAQANSARMELTAIIRRDILCYWTANRGPQMVIKSYCPNYVRYGQSENDSRVTYMSTLEYNTLVEPIHTTSSSPVWVDASADLGDVDGPDDIEVDDISATVTINEHGPTYISSAEDWLVRSACTTEEEYNQQLRNYLLKHPPVVYDKDQLVSRILADELDVKAYMFHSTIDNTLLKCYSVGGMCPIRYVKDDV